MDVLFKFYQGEIVQELSLSSKDITHITQTIADFANKLIHDMGYPVRVYDEGSKGTHGQVSFDTLD